MDCIDTLDACLITAAMTKSMLVILATAWGIRELGRMEPKKAESSDVDCQMPSVPGTPTSPESVFSEPECPYASMFPIEDAPHDISAELGDAFSVWRGHDDVDGPALVRYSQEKSAFLYWADVRLPWPVLEAMARQYVNDHRCRDLYVTPNTIVSTNTDEGTSAAPSSGPAESTDDPLPSAEQTNTEHQDEPPCVVSKPSNNYIRMGRLHAFHAPARGGKRDSNLTYGRFKEATSSGYFGSVSGS